MLRLRGPWGRGLFGGPGYIGSPEAPQGALWRRFSVRERLKEASLGIEVAQVAAEDGVQEPPEGQQVAVLRLPGGEEVLQDVVQARRTRQGLRGILQQHGGLRGWRRVVVEHRVDEVGAVRLQRVPGGAVGPEGVLVGPWGEQMITNFGRNILAHATNQNLGPKGRDRCQSKM